MSSILRALRRLESDAQSDNDPPLGSDVTIAPQAPRDTSWRLALALGALFFLLAMVLWVLLNRPKEAGPQTEAVDIVRVAPPHKASIPTAPRPAQRLTPVEATPAATPRPSSPVRDTTAAPRRRPVAVIESPPPAAPTPVAASPAAPPSPKDVAAPAPPSEVQEAATPSLVAGPAPLGIARIIWHPNAETRRAWVRVSGESKTQEVVEGDDVGNYRVERIDAASVLFRADGVELRRKLGESGP